MTISYQKRKEYFQKYYQAKKTSPGVKINTFNTQLEPLKVELQELKKLVLDFLPPVKPEPCAKCSELATLQKENENLRQQIATTQAQKREYWRQQKKRQREQRAVARSQKES